MSAAFISQASLTHICKRVEEGEAWAGAVFKVRDENPKIQFFEARYLSLLLCDRSFVLSATRVRRLLSSSQAMLFATKKETTIMAAMPARRRGKNE